MIEKENYGPALIIPPRQWLLLPEGMEAPLEHKWANLGPYQILKILTLMFAILQYFIPGRAHGAVVEGSHEGARLSLRISSDAPLICNRYAYDVALVGIFGPRGSLFRRAREFARRPLRVFHAGVAQLLREVHPVNGWLPVTLGTRR